MTWLITLVNHGLKLFCLYDLLISYTSLSSIIMLKKWGERVGSLSFTNQQFLSLYENTEVHFRGPNDSVSWDFPYICSFHYHWLLQILLVQQNVKTLLSRIPLVIDFNSKFCGFLSKMFRVFCAAP